MSTHKSAGGSVDKEKTIDAAARIVEAHGVEALSMRALAAELDVAVTAIYWHVGNRATLLDHLAERTVRELGDIHPVGNTTRERVISIAHGVRYMLLEHQPLVWLAHERGCSPLMMLPAERALVGEMDALGLDADDGALIIKAILHHVVGFMMVERGQDRQPEQYPTKKVLWSQDEQVRLGRGLAEAMAEPYDNRTVFDVSVRALVAGLLDSRG